MRLDAEGATAWLIERSRATKAWLTGSYLSVGAPLPARFSPQALAELEAQSEREKHRALYPSMILDAVDHEPETAAGRSGCCLWFPPARMDRAGSCPHSGLAIAQAEWRGDALEAVLATLAGTERRQEATPPVPETPPEPEAPQTKRGPKPQWDWEPIVREAKIAFAGTGGTMPWKNLVELIMGMAAEQTGKRPQSDSTAGELATQISRDWKRYVGEPAN